jgi:hypothetical protein
MRPEGGLCDPVSMSALDVQLHVRDDAFVARFHNTGPAPLALSLWWTRRLIVADAVGQVVPPGPGPVLPCGAPEELTVLAPGAVHEERQPLVCTQPAGGPLDVGWSHAGLQPGRSTVSLVFEMPPRHGFVQHAPHPDLFVGRLTTSNAVSWAVRPPPPPQGLWSRVASAWRR